MDFGKEYWRGWLVRRPTCSCWPHMLAYLQPPQEFDLTGSREFLTKETAEEVLAPLLAPGARFKKVRLPGEGTLVVAGLKYCRNY